MKSLLYKTWYGLKSRLLRDEFAINGWSKQEHIEIQKYIVEVLKPQKQDEILEFGCGTGLHLRNFSNFCREIVGIDHLKCMIERVKKNNLGRPNVKFMHCKAIKRLPFLDDRFDKIFSWSVFQYFVNRIEAENLLRELFRITKTNGMIFIGDIPSIIDKRYSLKLFVDYLNYFLYLFYDPFIFSKFCEQNFGETKIIFQKNSLPNYRSRFDILIKVKK
jgi:ubiquinone/menaquinone biosynthesis C-methylase UbiE